MKSERKKANLLRVICITALVAVACVCSPRAEAQLAIKTNLLYDATTTPNLGLELGVGSRSTINLVYGLNPWNFKSGDINRKAKHWVAMPEYRWWFCSKFDGHFIGVHAMGGQFNAANVNLPLPGGFVGGENIARQARDKRLEGWFVGGGITYGYQWVLSKHWNLEAEIGAGYDYVKYKKFKCDDCGAKIGEGHTNYLGVTKLGLSIIYLF